MTKNYTINGTISMFTYSVFDVWNRLFFTQYSIFDSRYSIFVIRYSWFALWFCIFDIRYSIEVLLVITHYTSDIGDCNFWSLISNILMFVDMLWIKLIQKFIEIVKTQQKQSLEQIEIKIIFQKRHKLNNINYISNNLRILRILSMLY